MPEVYQEFLKALQASRNGDSPREFLLVVSLGRSYGVEQLEQAMRQSLEEGRPDYERVRQLVIGTTSGGGTGPSRLEKVKVVLPDSGQFDRLWRAGDGEMVA